MRRIRFRRFLFCVRLFPAPGGTGSLSSVGGRFVLGVSAPSESESDSLEDELDEDEDDALELEDAEEEDDDDDEDEEAEDDSDDDTRGVDEPAGPRLAGIDASAGLLVDVGETFRARFAGRPEPFIAVGAEPLATGRFDDRAGGGPLELDRPEDRDEVGDDGSATCAADLAAIRAALPEWMLSSCRRVSALNILQGSIAG